jgi:glucokinase
MILGGDIGGTNSRIALFEIRAGRPVAVWRETYPSRSHAGLVEIARAAAAAAGLPIEAASFGVAGPVRQGRSRTTNLPWLVDSAELAVALGLPAVGLLNDLEANAYGLAALGPEDMLTLHQGDPGQGGNAALISAGTGLGKAGLFWDGRSFHPFASEGGHAGFAPTDALQARLWAWLASRYGHVSWERVVSGPGLHSIYQFLCEERSTADPAWQSAPIASGDPSAAIAASALAGANEMSMQALDLFTACYGAAAGDLALLLLATGGVYVGGGIAPKIADWLKRPPFLEGFFSKGRLRPLLETIPVRVVLNPDTALLGAARHAALRAGMLR